ncbi:MAG: YqeG family HAD IIIA-type phosphatase [Syntrophomonas sp.]
MLEKFYPKIYVDSLLEVPLDYLKALNIKAFILDLDNTVTEWNSNIVKSEVSAWFSEIAREGFKACILSNNGEQRVLEVARSLNIPYIHRAQKPRRGGFRRALAVMGTTVHETAVIGDQIFTDVWGGNRAGLYTILVVPINSREFMGTKISRAMETFILRRLTKYVEK